MALMALDCNAIWVWEMAEERSGSFMVLIIILIITKIKKILDFSTCFKNK